MLDGLMCQRDLFVYRNYQMVMDYNGETTVLTDRQPRAL
jgi:hypothetical protein